MAVSVKISKELERNLKLYRDTFNAKVTYKVSADAAKIISQKAKELVIVSKETIERKKNGKVIATYSPGNLKRSIGIKKFKGNSMAYVGPRIKGKGADSTGEFKGARVDGWYGHYVEYGMGWGKKARPYMRPAYESTKEIVKEKLIKGFTDEFNKVKTV